MQISFPFDNLKIWASRVNVLLIDSRWNISCTCDFHKIGIIFYCHNLRVTWPKYLALLFVIKQRSIMFGI